MESYIEDKKKIPFVPIIRILLSGWVVEIDSGFDPFSRNEIKIG